MDLTQELIEDFGERTASARDSGGQTKLIEESESFVRGLESAHRAGDFNVDTDIDFEMLLDAWAGDGDLVRGGSMRKAMGAGRESREIQEHALDVMTSSNFKVLVNTVVQQGILDMLDQSPYTLQSRVDRSIRLSADTTKLFGLHDLGDIVQPAAELEETQLFGLSGRSVTPPKAQKEKFGLGLTRELMALDTNSLIRTKMREGANSMALHAEKLIADMIFGCYDPLANPWPYIEDDVRWNTYYDIIAAGPWENELVGNALDGTYAPFQVMHNLEETFVDDYTGEPVSVNFRDIVVTSDFSRRLAQDALGILTIARDTATVPAVNERTEITRTSDNSFGSIVKSDYARKRLQAWYQTTAGGAMNAADALVAANGTWVVGDLQRAFAWGTEWDLETIERSSPDTWEYWNQEIVLLIKYMWKVTPLVKNPRLVAINRP